MQDAPAGLADDGEGFDEQVVEGGALGDSFLEFDGFRGEIDIGEGLELRLQVVDGGDRGPQRLDVALVLGCQKPLPVLRQS